MERIFVYEDMVKRFEDLEKQCMEDALKTGTSWDIRVTCGEDKNGLYWDITVE